MTRSQLALACALFSAMATAASAQQYPPYPMSGPGMPPSGMHPGMMQGTAPQGMYPGMAPGGMPPGMHPGMQRPMMPPGMQSGMPPGMQGGMPPGMQGGGMPGGGMPGGPGGMMSPEMMTQGTGKYRGKIPDAPMPKLPKGVKAQDGLLFYNGPAHGDIGFGGQGGQYPVQQAGYVQGAEVGMPPGAHAGVQQEGGVYGDVGHGVEGYGGEGYGGDCNDPNCQHCRKRHFPHNIFGFAGKLGYNWFTSADVVFMTRDSASNQNLVLNTTTQQPVLGSGGLDFDYETGGRVMFGFMGPSGISLQGVYLGVHGFESSVEIEGNNDLQIPNPLAADTIDFFGADRMRLDYTSDIDTAEFNVLYPWGSFQLVAGYRYLEVSEQAVIQSSDVIDGGTSDFSARSLNQLHGAQIGILGEWEAFGHVCFDFTAKFGVFNNHASQNQVLRDLDNTDLRRNTGGSDDDVAYVSELGAQLVVPLGPIFSIQGGYNVFFINRVALAPDQFDFTLDADSGQSVTGGSNIVFHGANVGFTAIW